MEVCNGCCVWTTMTDNGVHWVFAMVITEDVTLIQVLMLRYCCCNWEIAAPLRGRDDVRRLVWKVDDYY
jgi:hypothetical protein